MRGKSTIYNYFEKRNVSKSLNLGPGRTRANFVYFQFLASKNWQKFGKFQILAVVALDQHVLTKTSLTDMNVTRSTGNKTSRVFCAIDFILEFNSLQIFLYATCSWLSALQQHVISASNWTNSFRSACLCLCCCFHHLRSKMCSFSFNLSKKNIHSNFIFTDGLALIFLREV